MMRSLAEWLARLEASGPAPIALGLERVQIVEARLFDGAARPAAQVLTVAGTNGKGSVVGYADALLRAAGLRVGRYTSPHLLRFNERIAIDGQPVDDAALLRAFAAVESARAEVQLTYFEFTTLAALWLFQQARLDVAVLEVGLGGRLDAVNLVDPDVAVITSIGLDHQAYLGPDRDSIGFEKAGIARAGRPVLLGDRDPPARLLATLAERGARLQRLGRDFELSHATGEHARLRLADGSQLPLLPPPLPGAHQWDNLALAIAAVQTLQPGLQLGLDLQSRAWAGLVLPGRLQRLPAPIPAYVDVAHNPQAAEALAQWWADQPRPRHALFGLLADKDLDQVLAPLLPLVDHWHPLQLEGPRARPVSEIAEHLRSHGAKVHAEGDRRPQAVWPQLMERLKLPAEATADTPAAANASATANTPAAAGSIVASGSFLVVAAILALDHPQASDSR